MGILLVYDVTDEGSFRNVRNWMQNIQQHASEKVNKVGSFSFSLRNPYSGVSDLLVPSKCHRNAVIHCSLFNDVCLECL